MFEKFKKKDLVYVRIIAIALSCLIATMTFLNVMTVATHSIDFKLPREDSFEWAVDPVGKKLLFMSSFEVSNHGAFDIDKLDINAWLENSHGVRIIEFHREDMVISRGGDMTFDIIVTLPMDVFTPAGWIDFLSRDDTMSLMVDIDADYMFGLVHFTVDEVIQYPWEAPLDDMMDDMFSNENIMSGLTTILELAESGLNMAYASIAPSIMTLMEGLDGTTAYLYEGAELVLDIARVNDVSTDLACHITAPMSDGDLGFSINVQVDIQDGMISAELREVSFTYEA
ncbi:MAG: hypothetical protein KAS16_07955 [Thermoplasmata archaeon]|nr:hypothetical protein [Thermoplasmata archaeon]